MKTKTILLFLALAIVAGVFNACKKDKTTPDTPEISESTYIVNNVLNFSQQASLLNEGSYLKNGEKVPIDTALFYISATLNYIYCDHTAQYRELLFDTIKLEIPIIGQEGKTFLVDALAGFNEAVTQARTKFKLANGLNKKLLNFAFLNAFFNESSNEIIVNFQMQFGTGNAPIISTSGFSTEEQYWWFRGSYNCFDGNNNFGGAPDVLEQRLMFKFIQAPPANCRYWFPFTEIKKFNATSYIADGNGDNFCDYKIYYATGLEPQVLTNTVQCLGIDANHPGIHEMDFYLNNLDQIIAEFLLASNKSMQNLYIDSRSIPEIPNLTILHEPRLTYGKKSVICWDNSYPIGIE